MALQSPHDLEIEKDRLKDCFEKIRRFDYEPNYRINTQHVEFTALLGVKKNLDKIWQQLNIQLMIH